MARFIEKYVRRPIQEVGKYEREVEDKPGKTHIDLLDLRASYDAERITFQLGSFVREISRAEVQSLGEEEDDDRESSS